jgi:hypothetical protein
MKAKLKVLPTLQEKIETSKSLAEQKIERELVNIATDAVGLGSIIVPVDTGAYVTSFSFSTGAGRPRGKSSKGKPRKQNEITKKNEGLSNLTQDLEKIPSLLNVDTIVLRNNSPHARAVEYGKSEGYWPKKEGFFVFTKLENLYG